MSDHAMISHTYEAPPDILNLEQMMAHMRMVIALMNAKGSGLNETLDATILNDMTDAVIENAVGDRDAKIDTEVVQSAETDTFSGDLGDLDPEAIAILERYYSSSQQVLALLQDRGTPAAG